MCTFSDGGDSLDYGLLVHTTQGSQSRTGLLLLVQRELSASNPASEKQGEPGCPLPIPLPAPEEGREWGTEVGAYSPQVGLVAPKSLYTLVRRLPRGTIPRVPLAWLPTRLAPGLPDLRRG